MLTSIAATAFVIVVLWNNFVDSDWAARRRWRRLNRAADRARRCWVCGSRDATRWVSPWPRQGGVSPVLWRCQQHLR